jgi:hypothetical protein
LIIDRLAHHGLDLIPLGHVRLDSDGPATQVFDFSHYTLSRLIAFDLGHAVLVILVIHDVRIDHGNVGALLG